MRRYVEVHAAKRVLLKERDNDLQQRGNAW